MLLSYTCVLVCFIALLFELACYLFFLFFLKSYFFEDFFLFKYSPTFIVLEDDNTKVADAVLRWCTIEANKFELIIEYPLLNFFCHFTPSLKLAFTCHGCSCLDCNSIVTYFKNRDLFVSIKFKAFTYVGSSPLTNTCECLLLREL